MSVTCLTLALSAVVFTVGVSLAATTCNPLPIPDYPVGRYVRRVVKGAPADDPTLWLQAYQEQYRELADPTALWIDGTWYLYPSCDMAWVSTDEGVSWQHHPMNIRDVGYAPTVVRHGNRFLLMASDSPLYAASDPLGPFQEVGPVKVPEGSGAPALYDPMLFADDDGRLYLYWGCTATGGIWAVELKAVNPVQVVGRPDEVIPFRPDLFPWERAGDQNQDSRAGWMEGAWMLKRQGRYYLTYSAAGTQYRTYAMGCYTAQSPLGPFRPQARNSIFRTTEGLITGTAHGSFVEGPRNQLWVFYTIRAGVVHGFERRIGMDLAAFDAQGELYVPGATSDPQWVPGTAPDGAERAAGWLSLSCGGKIETSSCHAGQTGRLAVDEDLGTYWQPAAGDKHPALTVEFSALGTLRAVRVIWRDIGLDTPKGVLPGSFRYRVEVETGKAQWGVVIDREASTEDLLVDYRECKPVTGRRARLVVTGWPHGITPAVTEFTVFGQVNPLVIRK